MIILFVLCLTACAQEPPTAPTEKETIEPTDPAEVEEAIEAATSDEVKQLTEDLQSAMVLLHGVEVGLLSMEDEAAKRKAAVQLATQRDEERATLEVAEAVAVAKAKAKGPVIKGDSGKPGD